MPTPIIVGATPGEGANLYFTTAPPPSAGGTYNLSCHATALEIIPDTESVDIATMCAPGASDQGRTTYSAVASLLWSPGLYTLLEPGIGDALWVAFWPRGVLSNPTTWLSFATRYSSQPWGRFEIGQRVEVDLPLAVLSTPIWYTAP